MFEEAQLYAPVTRGDDGGGPAMAWRIFDS